MKRVRKISFISNDFSPYNEAWLQHGVILNVENSINAVLIEIVPDLVVFYFLKVWEEELVVGGKEEGIGAWKYWSVKPTCTCSSFLCSSKRWLFFIEESSWYWVRSWLSSFHLCCWYSWIKVSSLEYGCYLLSIQINYLYFNEFT
jgi:hypothetical protein